MTEFSEETLKDNFDEISKSYQDEFTSAGFPPKICCELLNQFAQSSKRDTMILDIGCGNGYVGLYLNDVEYKHIHGIDCSSIKLEEARKKNSYSSLKRGTFGLKDSVID
jgi:tRNA1(Val) A37 N6-methylase TrmN6